MDISNQIIRLREKKGITQAEIARMLDMVQSNYARLEKRGSKLTLEQIENIANALDVTVGELLGYSDSLRLAELENEIANVKEENKNLKTSNASILLVMVVLDQMFKDNIIIKNPQREGKNDILLEKITQAMQTILETNPNSKVDSK